MYLFTMSETRQYYSLFCKYSCIDFMLSLLDLAENEQWPSYLIWLQQTGFDPSAFLLHVKAELRESR